MTRGPEIAVLVDDLWGSLGKRKQADGKAPCVLRRTFDFLRSLPDYTEHLRATTPDNFAYLPADIIHEVVDAGERNLNCLVDVEGLWGEFAWKSNEKAKSRLWITFKFRKFLKRRLAAHSKFEYQPVSLEEVQDHPIHCTEIDEDSDFDQLRAVAPNLYESIEFTNVPHIPGDLISRIGNRFSSVKWLIEDITRNEEDENEKPTENYIKPEVADFLKHQLRSKYLRKLQIAALGFKQGEMDDLLIDFIKRPHFERLVLSESVYDIYGSERNPGGYALSFDVIKEAHKAWNSRDYFDVDRQDISGSISEETREQLKKYFKTNFEGRTRSHEVKHNSLPFATMEMTIYDKNEQLQFHMWCCYMQK